MKVGVFGAGAIGCFLGGRLIAAGHEVVLVGRLRDEIAKHGLRLTDYAGRDDRLAPTRVLYMDTAEQLDDADAILVTVKSAATSEAARALAGTRGSGVIVSFQNGVSNVPRIRKVLPDRRVLAGMVPFNVAHEGDGHFHNGTSGPLAIEDGGGVAAPIATALREAGFEVEVRTSLERVQWTKLVINLNNAVNALSGMPLRAQLHDRGYRRVMARIVREGLAVMKAEGIRPVRLGALVPQLAPIVLGLPNALFFRIATAMVKVDPQARSSMLDDLDRRRVTEVDYLNGEVLRLAARHGVAVPANRVVTDLVQQAEKARNGSPRIPAERLLSAIAALSS